MVGRLTTSACATQLVEGKGVWQTDIRTFLEGFLPTALSVSEITGTGDNEVTWTTIVGAISVFSPMRCNALAGSTFPKCFAHVLRG